MDGRQCVHVTLALCLLCSISGCQADLEQALTPEGPTLDEVLDDQPPAPAEPTDPTTTICDSFDFGPYESRCGEMSLSSRDLTAGDILTVTVNLTCGGATIACDYAEPGLTEVDGDQVEESGGYPQPYNYTPPKPGPRRNGSAVRLAKGEHTVRFFLKFSAPNDCLAVSSDNFFADGPFVIVGSGGGTWSSVESFRIRQNGI